MIKTYAFPKFIQFILAASAASLLWPSAAFASQGGGGLHLLEWDKTTPEAKGEGSYLQLINNITDDDGPVIQGFTPDDSTPPLHYPAVSDNEALRKYLDAHYPPCRNQGDFFTCWAHQAVAGAEFFQASNLGIQNDLSEAYLSTAIYRRMENKDVGNDAELTDMKFENNDRDMLMLGGNPVLTAQFLSKRYGYISENAMPYFSPENDARLDASDRLTVDPGELTGNAVCYLKNMYQINIRNETGLKLAKQAIMQNGAVGMCYYQQGNPEQLQYEYNAEHAAVYCPGEPSPNHAVVAVGWDDDFPAGNFAMEPPGDGAWLIRNSWGSEEEDILSRNNYFWLSYYDKSILDTVYVYEVSRDMSKIDHDYHYDSQIHALTSRQGACSSANVFTAAGSGERLTEVTVETENPTGYSIRIYTDLKDPSDPESGELQEASSVSGTFPFAGVYTIPLSHEAYLAKGKQFSIIIDTDTCSPASEVDFTDWAYNGLTVTCGIKKGQSFVKQGGVWADLADSGNKNFCIAAHTRDTGEEPEEGMQDGSGTPAGQDTLIISDISGNPVTLIRNEDGGWQTENGTTVFIISLGDGESAPPSPEYQYTGTKITPGKDGYVVFDGILYRAGADYKAKYKKNKNAGSAEAVIKWVKGSGPYLAGNKKTKQAFTISPRTVSENMVNIEPKGDKIKKVSVAIKDNTVKARKKDYTYEKQGVPGFLIRFRNNFQGEVLLE